MHEGQEGHGQERRFRFDPMATPGIESVELQGPISRVGAPNSRGVPTARMTAWVTNMRVKSKRIRHGRAGREAAAYRPPDRALLGRVGSRTGCRNAPAGRAETALRPRDAMLESRSLARLVEPLVAKVNPAELEARSRPARERALTSEGSNGSGRAVDRDTGGGGRRSDRRSGRDECERARRRRRDRRCGAISSTFEARSSTSDGEGVMHLPMLFGQSGGDPLLIPGVHWAELLIIVIRVLVAFGALLVSVMLMIWFERKLISDMQDRIGPNRAGPFGILQTLADGIKLFFKEDLLPERADPFVFKLAPYLSIVPALDRVHDRARRRIRDDRAGTPSSYRSRTRRSGSCLLLAMSSISVYGVMLAGWASGSKYPLLGAVRASAQMISYEAALGLTIVTTIIVTGTAVTVGSLSTQGDRGEPGGTLLGLERAAPRGRPVRDLPDCDHGGAEPAAVRPRRGRAGAGRRLPHGVLVDPFRPVLHGGVHEHDHDVGGRRDPVLRRTGRPGAARA